MRRKILLSKICHEMGIEFVGDDKQIDGINLCDRKTDFANIISYATRSKYVKYVKNNTRICCMIIPPELIKEFSDENLGRKISFIIAGDAEKVFYSVFDYLNDKCDFFDKFDSESKIVKNCNIANTAVIGTGCIIGNRVSIGENTVILPGTVIEDDCIIGSNSTIGTDGFQLIRNDGYYRSVKHVGQVLIKSNTEIGSNVVICKSLFEGYTYIGSHVHIDNSTCISHNSYIDDGVVMVSGAFLCGSCTVNKGAWIGPNATVMNKVVIGEKAKVGIGSVVLRNVKPGITVFGNPAKPLEI